MPRMQVDVFSEVAILERFRGQPSTCQLLNYGIEGDAFVLVMRKYAASLKSWRACIASPPAAQLRLYLHIFADIIAAVQVFSPLMVSGLAHALKKDKCLIAAGLACFPSTMLIRGWR
jgi:hypothetical protein